MAQRPHSRPDAGQRLIAPLASFHNKILYTASVPPASTPPYVTGAQMMAELSTPSLMICAQDDEPWVAEMRAAGYKGEVLQYFMANESKGPCAATCSSPGWAGWTNQVVNTDAEYAARTEASFVHNQVAGGAIPANRLYDGRDAGDLQYDHQHVPDNADWMSFWNTKTNVAFNDASRPYAGCMLDNVEEGSISGRYANDATGYLEYSDHASNKAPWKAAVLAGLANKKANLAVSKLGAGNRWARRLWANITTPEPPTLPDEWAAIRAHLDGMLLESFACNWNSLAAFDAGWRPQAETEMQMANIRAWLQAGRGVIVAVQGPQLADPAPEQNFALCLFWMVYEPGAYFRWAASDSSGYRYWTHFANYLTDVGLPLGPAVRVSATKYARRFAKRTITADFATHLGTIS